MTHLQLLIALAKALEGDITLINQPVRILNITENQEQDGKAFSLLNPGGGSGVVLTYRSHER